jgi:hypothetical protein
MRLLLALPFALALGAADATLIFVDDAALVEKTGVRRVLHACKKLPQPVLQPERPWEGNRIYTYGSVHFDPARKLYRMWYNARIAVEDAAAFDNPDLRGADLVLHATSADGVHWTREDAGIFTYRGSKANNVVHHYHSPSVVIDDSDPARRFRMVGYGRKFHGYSTAVSRDGLHWTDTPNNPIVPATDTVTMTRNPATGEYLVFHKQPAEVRGFKRRSIWLTTSRDFVTWSKPQVVLVPDEKDDEWARLPGQHTELYVMSAFPYAGRLLGLVSMFRLEQRRDRASTKPFSPSQRPSGDDGPIDIQLVISDDGRKWARTEERAPVIPLGPKGSYDAGCILGVSNALVAGDEIWVYYTAITTTHGGDLPAKRISIGRAAWRLDGFASLHAESGRVRTKDLPVAGKRLTVNATAKGGAVEVEALDAAGKPIAGFARADCRPLSGDRVRQPARWRGGERLPTAARSLRVHLKNADLYALRIEP